MGNRAMSIMTWYPIQSHYPDTEPTSSCQILIIPSTWLCKWKSINLKIIGLTWRGFIPARFGFAHLLKQETGTLLIRLSLLVDQARKRQVSIWWVIGLLRSGTELAISRTRGLCSTDSATLPGAKELHWRVGLAGSLIPLPVFVSAPGLSSCSYCLRHTVPKLTPDGHPNILKNIIKNKNKSIDQYKIYLKKYIF